MFEVIRTASLSGVTGRGVDVEVDIRRGLPSFNTVGLADTTIKEACSRIKPAINNSGYSFPNERITVNLAPAGRHKEGSHFDLPIALGITAISEGLAIPQDTAFFGELSLDGKVNDIRGALPLAMGMRKEGIKNMVFPKESGYEAAVLEDINVYQVETLNDAVRYIIDRSGFKPCNAPNLDVFNQKEKVDFSQVRGQERAKRAFTVSAAGNHGLLMIGGPGCGKTMMAKRMPTILPKLTYEEKLEITGIYSVAGMLSKEEPIITSPPFRSPHMTISKVALVGGGAKPKPGELSFAHRGVLFLDELGEFDLRTIDSMRQPVEEGCVRINRRLEEVIFPSQVLIIAAANPCRCGYLWDERKVCVCTENQISGYRRKLTGPFSDRIDMHIKMNPVKKELIDGYGSTEDSAHMRSKVEMAREVQRYRYRDCSFSDNGRLDEKNTYIYCKTDREGEQLLREAYEKLGLSMRAYIKILKLSRTIADIRGAEKIGSEDIAEALSYRMINWE